MAKIVKADVAELIRENSILKSENSRLEAFLEYVAMMADVELPEPEDFLEDEDE